MNDLETLVEAGGLRMADLGARATELRHRVGEARGDLEQAAAHLETQGAALGASAVKALEVLDTAARRAGESSAAAEKALQQSASVVAAREADLAARLVRLDERRARVQAELSRLQAGLDEHREQASARLAASARRTREAFASAAGALQAVAQVAERDLAPELVQRQRQVQAEREATQALLSGSVLPRLAEARETARRHLQSLGDSLGAELRAQPQAARRSAQAALADLGACVDALLAAHVESAAALEQHYVPQRAALADRAEEFARASRKHLEVAGPAAVGLKGMVELCRRLETLLIEAGLLEPRAGAGTP